jgi:hypothetical protein
LWRLGFQIQTIAAINLLSGLADIHEIEWLPDREIFVLVVTNRDKTDTLFREGMLGGCPINEYQPTKQGLVVEWPKGRNFARGGN